MRKEKLGKDYIKITPEIESRIKHALEEHYDLQNCDSEDEREKFVNNFIEMDFGDQFVELSLDCLMSQRDIAKIYGITHQAVSNRLRSHDRYIAHLESEKEAAKRIEKRLVKFIPRNQHLTINELAERFGIARETLVKIMKRNKIKKKNVTTSTNMKMVDKVREIIMTNPEITQTEIAEKLGIGQSTVSKYIRLFNIEYTRKS